MDDLVKTVTTVGDSSWLFGFGESKTAKSYRLDKIVHASYILFKTVQAALIMNTYKPS